MKIPQLRIVGFFSPTFRQSDLEKLGYRGGAIAQNRTIRYWKVGGTSENLVRMIGKDTPALKTISKCQQARQ